MEDGRELLNMCANNYLGLGDNQRLIDAAKRTYDEKGYGVASVRFICGTQDIHKKLEKKISGFLGTDDTILYSSCFDALTEFVFVRQKDTAIKIITWKIWKHSFRLQMQQEQESN